MSALVPSLKLNHSCSNWSTQSDCLACPNRYGNMPNFYCGITRRMAISSLRTKRCLTYPALCHRSSGCKRKLGLLSWGWTSSTSKMATELFSVFSHQSVWRSQRGVGYQVTADLDCGSICYYADDCETVERAFYRACRRTFLRRYLPWLAPPPRKWDQDHWNQR